MGRYIAAKLVHLAVVMLLVTLATFALLDLMPGGPEYAIAGPEATPAEIAKVKHDYGLDDPFVVRYGRWLGDALHGDLGRSFRDNHPVADELVARLPVTFELALLAMIVGLVIAVPLGIVQAYRSRKPSDKALSFGATLVVSVPQFLLAVILVAVFAVRLGWFPTSGLARITEEGLWANLRSLALPAITLGLAEAAVLSQVLRADMIGTLGEDYILSARAKGMPTTNVLFRQALRPSSFSLLTLAAISAGRLLGGAVVIEVLFGLPGIGKMMVDAISTGEVIKVQAGVLVIATIYVVLNALTDVMYGVLDPRVRDAR
jgi:peptide/nickel transport system permease protein